MAPEPQTQRLYPVFIKSTDSNENGCSEIISKYLSACAIPNFLTPY